MSFYIKCKNFAYSLKLNRMIVQNPGPPSSVSNNDFFKLSAKSNKLRSGVFVVSKMRLCRAISLTNTTTDYVVDSHIYFSDTNDW